MANAADEKDDGVADENDFAELEQAIGKKTVRACSASRARATRLTRRLALSPRPHARAAADD